MQTLLIRLRRTRPSWAAGGIRLLLGLLFLTTGLMKLLVPDLRAAFSGQLTEAAIPFHSLNMWFVPIAEVAVGVVLIVGLLSRLASLVAITSMLVATYVHLVVHNPDLFPLQPEAPTIPLVALALSAYVLWVGGGSCSMDLRGQRDEGTVRKGGE